MCQVVWLMCVHSMAMVYSVVDEVWQQQTVLRLLQLIELPLLESLLEGREKPRPSLHGMDSDPDLLYTSNYVDREILKAFSESQYVETLSKTCHYLFRLFSLQILTIYYILWIKPYWLLFLVSKQSYILFMVL